jgi:uncharacterized C2H2 Zn-finger protein
VRSRWPSEKQSNETPSQDSVFRSTVPSKPGSPLRSRTFLRSQSYETHQNKVAKYVFRSPVPKVGMNRLGDGLPFLRCPRGDLTFWFTSFGLSRYNNEGSSVVKGFLHCFLPDPGVVGSGCPTASSGPTYLSRAPKVTPPGSKTLCPRAHSFATYTQSGRFLGSLLGGEARYRRQPRSLFQSECESDRPKAGPPPVGLGVCFANLVL